MTSEQVRLLCGLAGAYVDMAVISNLNGCCVLSVGRDAETGALTKEHIVQDCCATLLETDSVAGSQYSTYVLFDCEAESDYMLMAVREIQPDTAEVLWVKPFISRSFITKYFDLQFPESELLGMLESMYGMKALSFIPLGGNSYYIETSDAGNSSIIVVIEPILGTDGLIRITKEFRLN